MAYFPVSIARNRPFISEICFITFIIFLVPNRIMDRVDDCASSGAIRIELGAIVSTMMTGSSSEIKMSDCNEFVPIG